MPVSRRSALAAAAGTILARHELAAVAAQDATPEPAPADDAARRLGPQPSYDVLRLFDGDSIQPYHLLVDWVPAIATTPDGGAWIFFGAQARAREGYGPRKVYASRYDPVAAVWRPAEAMPGDETQFAPCAEVDGDGVVHVVFSSAVAGAGPSSKLVYLRSDGETGWTEPVPIAPDEAAGFQMMSSLAVDEDGVPHVIWRDQRRASVDLRAAHPANGDLFSSDLADGAWSAPQLVLPRPDDTVVVGWPHLAVSGDRLVAVWSVYSRTGEDAMGTPTAVLWASRPLADPAAPWSEATPVLTDSEGDIGGRLVDLARDRDGNLALLSGDFGKGVNALSLYRLAAGANAWSAPESVATGDFGYMPDTVFDAEGGLVVVFNSGRNRNVEIGALRIGRDGAASEPVTISPAEEGLEARAAVAISSSGAVWVAYMHQPDDESPATELRVLRGADLSAPR